MTVRPASVEDAAAVAAVHVRAWQVAYAHVFPAAALAALDLPARAQRWRGILAAGTPVLVAGEPVAGFAALDPGELRALYVDPERWGGGLGRALLAAAEAALRGGGHAEATLWVLDANPRARRFYEVAGWRADGGSKRAVHLGVPVTELRYRKRLAV